MINRLITIIIRLIIILITNNYDLKNTVAVQSWKAAHLPTLEIRVEQGGIVLIFSDVRFRS